MVRAGWLMRLKKFLKMHAFFPHCETVQGFDLLLGIGKKRSVKNDYLSVSDCLNCLNQGTRVKKAAIVLAGKDQGCEMKAETLRFSELSFP